MMRSLVLAAGLSLAAAPAFAPLAAAPPVSAPVSAPAAAPAVATAQDRFVLLEGGRNFRDAGGYRTADGHTVKTGQLYRSGSLGGLTAAGQARVASLHPAAIIDLRTTQERSGDSNDLRGAFGTRYWTRDYAMSLGNMSAQFSDRSKLTGEGMRAMMAHAYRTMPVEQVPAYREMFAQLVSGHAPLIVNCTAGKDRTGIAVALVLTALGVPYETVRQDFLLSNGAPGMDTLKGSLSSSLSPSLAALPADVLAPLIGVDGSYLDTAFAQLTQDYGSIDGFLQKELNVGPKEVAVLRQRMLN